MPQMSVPQVPTVSVIDPIEPAFERVKTILFRPFDLGKWFVIGFCAWLAQLGSGSSGPGGNNGRYNVSRDNIRHEAERAWEYVTHNLDWILPVTIGGIVVFVGVWLLLLWLSSRGRFMFLYCVVQNRAQVTDPWGRFRGHGNSLFAFRAVLGLIAFGAALVPFIVGGIVVSLSKATLGFTPLTILALLAAGVYSVAVLIVAGVIGKLTKDFVVPIMYLHAVRPTAAWRVLLDLVSVNKARFFLYLLVQAVIGMTIVTLVLMAACCTCCLAACLFALPYIRTVVLLPVHVFTRSY
ncbi:MAG: hypothetical protein KBE65_23885, partial [Phycisphaerae bacterium]|nr:hypothetical protein [Phycisphaerae bacterium]